MDHVLDHPEAGRVAAVDEPLVALGAAVRLVDGVPEDAVVAPVVGAVDRVDRHQLDEVDPEAAQVVEAGERGVEGALRRERADVQLVDDRPGQLPPGPGLVGPPEAGGVVGSRALVDARRLTPRPRIGSRRVRVVDQVAVVGLLPRDCRSSAGVHQSSSPRTISTMSSPTDSRSRCARGAHTSKGPRCGELTTRPRPARRRRRRRARRRPGAARSGGRARSRPSRPCPRARGAAGSPR